ncbi:alpha-glucan family phosphorylase [Echinicola jeungdonensis]|uniref:glycogen phosphorylase n=1 Tax=Echinicola jeungdonensis TaxID=709343 RepID=A0ABV5J5Y2_9BACT|nr:alpha-glucan family phosphorylase [Echinicola jeungdonensis]MDN3668089.1 alpha-glucan family phosphorylase [Echinicola jeungdonensis]
MTNPSIIQPDYLFEVSWEVCNKVGGIYAVLATKAPIIERNFHERLMMIGPDVWKGTGDHPEFIEDKTLFKVWRQYVDQEGLKIKIGRWNIQGNPIAILVDFTPFFFEKNEIFKHFWIKYQLDSLNGQWDYIEPAMFGYAAGKVIESFYRCHINSTDRVVAQFHEWMTGTGLLYLEEKVPQVATVFTTHATVTGRVIAGKGLPFYQHLGQYNPEQIARESNVLSKHSLEKITAQNADCFTTVSEMTARECEKMLGKYPDLITPNGFDNSMVPVPPHLDNQRELARKRIIHVAEGLFNQKFPLDSLLIIKSGRNEFKNKGIDVFIDTLAEIRNHRAPAKKVIALIFVPGHHTGPRKELVDRISQPNFEHPKPTELLTHHLQGVETDPIMQRIKKMELNQSLDENLKVIFVPTYLDGNDGIFNMPYYDLLMGFDLAVFPSFYEPWGYTPLESLAFYIPALTTDVSGFGTALLQLKEKAQRGVYVIERNEGNDQEVVKKIADIIEDFSKKSVAEIMEIREDARRISQFFLWEKQIKYYEQAFNLALEISSERDSLYRDKPQAVPLEPVEIMESKPVWREVTVKSALPFALRGLQRLSTNLWWSWNEPAKALFEEASQETWIKCHQNPLAFLQSLHYSVIEKLANNAAYTQKLEEVMREFEKYMNAPLIDKGLVAYFSMEYGIHNTLKLYSGGLGILAGDFLKEASDSGLPMVGLGLMYKNGYFKQRLSIYGEQLMEPAGMDFSTLPIQQVTNKENQVLKIALPFPGRTVNAQVWKLEIGRVQLFLLDSFLEENQQEDKWITTQLYGGIQENRLRQELLLGLGGIQVLEALDIHPEVYHCNEGHAAFVGIARLQSLILNDNLSFEEAVEVVRTSSLFTTHTSVPAAIDKFSEELLRPYISHFSQQFNIPWETLMNLGRAKENLLEESFSMTNLAMKLSQEVNAVSRIHQKVSCQLFQDLWKDYLPEELHIGYVTNGVHYDTWTAPAWKVLYEKYFEEGFHKNAKYWEKIYDVPDQEIWNTNVQLKRELLTSIKERLTETMRQRHESPRKIREAISQIREDALVIGFARRFVTYKRPELILTDLNRLQRILNKESNPVLLFFAGKAHPQDKVSIELIKRVHETSLGGGLRNKIFFLEDYDMNLAKLMVQGVDLWMNTPNRQKEASGTSGMKALLNGTLNFSVLDGWWAEAYDEKMGWALDLEAEYERQDFQNELDSDKIYKTLENEIIPLFFKRNSEDLPVTWIQLIKAAISVAPHFTMHRTLMDYQHNFYNKLLEKGQRMRADGFAAAKELALWKKKVWRNWNDLDVLRISPEIISDWSKEVDIKLTLNMGDFTINDIGVEMIILRKKHIDSEDGHRTFELCAHEIGKEKVVFEGQIPALQPGNYEYSFRIYPKNPLLTHRQDFPLVRWV